jgi:glycosyltransferase involved in cell wall biosynthesis
MCAELTNAGHQVEVVTAMPHHPAGRIFPAYRHRFYLEELRHGVSIHRVWVYAGNGASFKRILSYLSFGLTCLYALLRVTRPDYVFVDSPPLTLGIPGWLAAKKYKARLVFNVADLWPDSARDLGIMRNGILMRAAYRLERWIYRRADYITSVTEGIWETLLREKNVPPEKLLFLPNGVDTTRFYPRHADEKLKQTLGLAGKRVMLYAGNHGYAGGVDQILLAADRLRSDVSIHFLLLGEGPEKTKLIAMAESLGLSNVTFHDAVAIEDLPAYISICDLAVVTLRRSQITKGARPAKTFVMMASGKPIVLAGEGEAEQLLRAAGAGIIVPPEEPDSLAKAVRTLLADTSASEKMGLNGRAFVCARFGWPWLVQNWLSQLNARVPTGSTGRTVSVGQGQASASS